jgi:hypothetical protein
MKVPRDTAGTSMPLLVAQAYPEFAKHGYHYLDMWPISQQMMTVWNPDMVAQFTQDTSLPKHYQMECAFSLT